MFNSLYERLTKKIPLTPVAGNDGFYRTIRWIQLDDHPAGFELLRSGDLVITTGYTGWDAEPDKMIHYINRLIKLNACGLIIHPGTDYSVSPAGRPDAESVASADISAPQSENISKTDAPSKNSIEDSEVLLNNEFIISDKVISYCNEFHFPLLLVQEKIHIMDIIRETCMMLFEFDHSYDVIYDILSGLLYDTNITNKNMEQIRRFGFRLEDEYTILAFQDDAETSFYQADERNYEFLNRFFFHLGERFFYFREAGYGIILINSSDEEKIESYAVDIVTNLTEIHSDETIRCGIGTCVHSICDIKSSFRNARAALSYAKFKNISNISFDELGFYKMLFSSDEQERLADYTTCLEPIISYDRKHNSDLVKTLAVYMKSGRSIQRVASELSCHRNTINYRIRRIEDLLYLDINDYENAFTLELAFRVLEYLNELKLEELQHESTEPFD